MEWCRRRRRPRDYPNPINAMRMRTPLPLLVTVAMVAVVVAFSPTTLEIATAFRVGIFPALRSGPVTVGGDGVPLRGRDHSGAAVAVGQSLAGEWGRRPRVIRGEGTAGPECDNGHSGSVRRRRRVEDRGGRDLRVGIIDDVVERDEKGGEEASGGEGAEADVSRDDANATETVSVDVELPPFSLVLSLALDVPTPDYPSGVGGDNSSTLDVPVDTARNDGGEEEGDPSSTSELNLNHTIVKEVKTLTEIYLLDQLSVLLDPILPSSVIIEDVVLNVTSVEVLLQPAPDGVRRERRRVLRTWLVSKAANDDEEAKKDEGEQPKSLRIKLYFEGFVRFAVPIPASSSSNSTALTGPLPNEATLKRALETALRRTLRTALSGTNLNDPDDEGSLLSLFSNGGTENSDVEGDEAIEADGDGESIELSTVTEITGTLEAPPQPQTPLPPGPVPPPPPMGGEGDGGGIEDTNTTVGDEGANDEQAPPGPQPPSQGEMDDVNGNSTTEDDGGASQGDGTTFEGSNATFDGTEEGEKEEQEPIAEGSGGPVSGGTNGTDSNTTKDIEEVGDGEGKQEQSGNDTIIGGGENATIDGTIGDGDVDESGDPSGGEDASTGGATVMSAGVIAVLAIAAVAVVGELCILAVSAYRGRPPKMSPPAAGGVEGEYSNDPSTIMKVHVAGGDLAGRDALEGQRPGRSFDTFDSDATGNTIDVVAPLGAAAALRRGGAGDDGARETNSKLSHYDVNSAVTGLGGLDQDLGDFDLREERGQSDVEIADGSASLVFKPIQKDADAVEDRRQDDGSTKLSPSDKSKNGADYGDVEKEDRVEDDKVVFSSNDSGGTGLAHVSEKVEDGTSADTSAADKGVELEAVPVAALAGAVLPVAAAEKKEPHADEKGDEVVAGTTKLPSVDAIPRSAHQPSVLEKVQDGTPADDTRAADEGIEYAGVPMSALSGAVSPAEAAEAAEATEQHADDKGDEVVAGKAMLPFADAIPGRWNPSSVPEKVENGTSADDTPATDEGIEFEATPMCSFAGAVSPAAAEEATEQHAVNKGDEVVNRTTKLPFVDESPGGEPDPPAPNVPVNVDASDLSSGRRADVAGCAPSSASLPFEQVCQNTSSGEPPQEDHGMDVTAMDTVTDTNRAITRRGDDNPDDAVDTKADPAAEASRAVQRSPSPLPAIPNFQEPRQQPLAQPEATGTVDGEASHRSNLSSSWSIHASSEVPSEEVSDGAASSLLEGRKKDTETKEMERNEGDRCNEEKKPAMAVKRTLSQLSPQRLVRKAKLLRKSSTSSTLGKTPLSVDKKEAGHPIDPSRPHDDDSSSGYVDSSVGDTPSDHHKDGHSTHHHGEDSSFDDNSAYAYSEGSLAWSYDKVAHPSDLSRAASNDTSVPDDVKDAASNPSEPLKQSTASLMVDLAEFV